MGLKANAIGLAWFAAPSIMVLPEDEIHVWRADTTRFTTHEQLLTELLTTEELEKAYRFRQQEDRNRSIFTRAVLREILARYMNLDARRIQFQLGERGKPMTDQNTHPGAPCFNVSHSGGIVLLAFTRKHSIGVDVEAIQHDLDIMEIAQQFFSPREVDELFSLPAPSRVRAFFDCWTRKEAYVKARADGIGSGLNQFAVTLKPEEPARLISDDNCPHEVANWYLNDIPLGLDYASAIAVAGGKLRTQYWKWDGKCI